MVANGRDVPPAYLRQRMYNRGESAGVPIDVGVWLTERHFAVYMRGVEVPAHGDLAYITFVRNWWCSSIYETDTCGLPKTRKVEDKHD
jgi:hypothetical protein